MAHPDNRMINLVRRAKKGDQRAFDKILKELEPDIKKKINPKLFY